MIVHSSILIVAFVLIFGSVAAGCTPLSRTPAEPAAEPAGSCILSLADDATDEDAIGSVLRAEGELVVAQEIDRLMSIWAVGGQVIDAKNTPDNGDDDQFWNDTDAIRHRYVRIVFPGAPTLATPADLQIRIQDDRADVIATTNIGSEVAPAGDHWTLVKQNGCWLIQSLTYNLEPATQ